MSSTGTVNRRVIAGTTLMSERQRSVDGEMVSNPAMLEGLHAQFGNISEVHPAMSWVKAKDNKGIPIGDPRKWIPLNHSAKELAERFGKVTIGMRVLVIYKGPNVKDASAFIVAETAIKKPVANFVPNVASIGIQKIFPPGSGI